MTISYPFATSLTHSLNAIHQLSHYDYHISGNHSRHRELEEYYNEVVNSKNDQDRQQRFGNQFVWELARHSVGEELVLYPAMEQRLGAKGKEMADSDRKEHHSVRLLRTKIVKTH